MTAVVFGKGFNFDLPASELGPGFWSGGSNFRFRAGVDEMWDGNTLVYSSGANVPLWGLTYATTTTKYAPYATATKFYAQHGNTATEITRKTDGKVISSLTAAGTTVTVVTATAHGLSTGNNITAYGNVPDEYDAGGVNVVVVDPTTFTYVTAVAPGVSPATVIGGYYGSATSNFNALSNTTQKYTGGAFNGVFLFNHPQDGLYYWQGSTPNPVAKVPGFHSATAWHTAVSVRPFKQFIVVMGPTVDGAWRRQNVSWSHPVSDPGVTPTSFSSTSTNLAGDQYLTETAGYAVDGLPLGDSFIVYFSDARYLMQYVEGSESVMLFRRLQGGDGLAYASCVVDTPLGHVFMTPDFDIKLHAGGEAKSVIDGKHKKFLASNIALAYAQNSFLAHDPQKGEVWVAFPTTSTVACDKALVWNYREDTWGYFDLTSGATSASGVTFAAMGQWPNNSLTRENFASLGMLCYHSTDSAKTGVYGTADTPTGQFFGTDITGTLIREGMDMGDRDLMKTLHRSRWNIDGTAGDTASIYHGSSKFADTAATYASAVTYTVGTTDYANQRATQGRFLALKVITGTVSTTLRFRSADIEIAPGGAR